MNAAAELLTILGIAAVGASVTYVVKGPPSGVYVCDPARLLPDEICLQQIKEPVLWIDARSRSEWMHDGLPGSELWNLDAKEDTQKMEASVVEKALHASLVVVYCSSESCGTSRQVANKIRALDLGAPVKVLKGGSDALKYKK